MVYAHAAVDFVAGLDESVGDVRGCEGVWGDVDVEGVVLSPSVGEECGDGYGEGVGVCVEELVPLLGVEVGFGAVGVECVAVGGECDVEVCGGVGLEGEVEWGDGGGYGYADVVGVDLWGVVDGCGVGGCGVGAGVEEEGEEEEWECVCVGVHVCVGFGGKYREKIWIFFWGGGGDGGEGATVRFGHAWRRRDAAGGRLYMRGLPLEVHNTHVRVGFGYAWGGGGDGGGVSWVWIGGCRRPSRWWRGGCLGVGGCCGGVV